MSEQTKKENLSLREAAAEGARLMKDRKVKAEVAAILKPLVHNAKKVLGYRDDQLAKAKKRAGKGR